jgi:serine protease Do
MKDVTRVSAAVVCMAFGLGSGRAVAGPFDPQPGRAPAAQVWRIGGATSYLGVNIREIDSERAKELKLKEEAGVEITRIVEDSPAAKAGLKVGDVVLAYNGERVEGMEQFSRLVRETPPGRDVRLLISRDGNSQTLTAKITSRKLTPFVVGAMPKVEIPAIAPAPMPDLPRALMMWRSSMLGIEAEALHGQFAEYFGVKEGVLVRSVMTDTPAAKAGLRAGDVIVKIDDTKVASPNDVSAAIRSLREKKSFPITIMRDKHEMTVTATVDDDRSRWEPFQRFERIERTNKM